MAEVTRADNRHYGENHYSRAQPHRGSSHLDRPSTAKSKWITLALLIYVVLAIFSWAVVSVQSFRPINRSSYSWNDLQDYYADTFGQDALFTQNDQYYQASRIIVMIIAVFTIPLVWMICSATQGTYIKRNRQSMRQAITIADHHRGPYLFLTLSLCILGAAVCILQLVLVSSQSIYTPSEVNLQYLPDQNSDIISALDGGPVLEYSYDAATILGALRNSLATTSGGDALAGLWQGNTTCSASTYGSINGLSGDRQLLCAIGGNDLQNISALNGAFIASQPYGYSTGLISQFAPRLNSSTRYEEYPSFPNCDSSNSWSRKYSNISTYVSQDYNDTQSWDVEICMPDTTASFKNIRARQDITESLYLKITMDNPQLNTDNGPVNNYTVKITLNTTSGYFELPNYMNQQMPGSLLAGSPKDACGNSCYDQSFGPRIITGSGIQSVGPLFRIAQALFGNGSILDTLGQNPQGYQLPGYSNADLSAAEQVQVETCVQYLPMTQLLGPSAGYGYRTPASCIHYFDRPLDVSRNWLLNFVNNTENMKAAFDASAAITNNLWLNTRNTGRGYLISLDFGTQHLKPVIALPSLIVISLLLGIFLISLVFVRIYGYLGKSTKIMNSLFMIKLGAMNYRRLGDENPAVVNAALDEIPGWVEEEKVIITDDMELN